jgi:hypothetical protein
VTEASPGGVVTDARRGEKKYTKRPDDEQYENKTGRQGREEREGGGRERERERRKRVGEKEEKEEEGEGWGSMVRRKRGVAHL